MKVRAAVFASGGGSNFQALLDHQTPDGTWSIVLLVSDREHAGAIERAAAANVPSAVIATSGRDASAVAQEMLELLARHRVALILLAGYVKLIPREVVARYRGRMLNVHPALLPAFGGKGMYGKRVHTAVIESGARESGATVHFVDEEYDRGPIVAQRRVPVLAGDTAEELAARVLAVEHELYPLAVDHVCQALAAGLEPTPMTQSLRNTIEESTR
ncbi:MAG: phosphoribosylglycinamide formyltransferase [Gemmatimonadetes bacterium]|nr:phosphoribosylglycinamide formyltransferase [Gemmatimonadota bacterium]